MAETAEEEIECTTCEKRDECTSPMKDRTKDDTSDADPRLAMMAGAIDAIHDIVHRISELNNVMPMIIGLLAVEHSATTADVDQAVAFGKQVAREFARLKFAATMTAGQLPLPLRTMMTAEVSALLDTYRAAAAAADESGAEQIVVKL